MTTNTNRQQWYLHRLHGGEAKYYGPDGAPYAVTASAGHGARPLVGRTKRQAWVYAQTVVIPALRGQS